MKMAHLDQKDPVIPNFDKANVPHMISGLHPQLQAAFLKQLRGGSVDVTAFQKKVVGEEIEYEELPLQENQEEDV